MPIYEYKCDACGYLFEEIQKFSDLPIKNCPKCKQDGVEKIISAAGFRLKGTGWYETDFKDKKPVKDQESTIEKKITKDQKET